MAQGLLIAQVGRSGGTWLSKVLSLDKRWTVHHEHGGLSARKLLFSTVKKRLMTPLYCDVSHLHNEIAPYICCGKAVILRNPIDVFASYAVRTRESKIRFCDRVDGMYLALDLMLERGAYLLQFDRMFTDRLYLQGFFDFFGFEIPMEKIDWRKVNQRVGRADPPNTWRGLLQRNAIRVWEKWSD